MIPQSILDMINNATKTAYILTTFEYLQNECKSHTDFCKGCFLFIGPDKQKRCFFADDYFTGSTPEEWDLKELERRLQNDKR